jgi:hypothetical protein
LTAVAYALCLVLILALIAVHTPPVRRIVAGRVTAFFASRHIDVSVVDLRYNLPRASMTMRDVRVHPTAWRNAHALLTIGRAHIDVSLPASLRGRYVVQTGEVDLSYFVDEHGSQERSSSTLTVPGAEVNGRVEVTSDRQLQVTVTTRSGDLEQLLSLIESLTGRLRLVARPTHRRARRDRALGLGWPF